MPAPPRSLMDRLMDRVVVDDSGCWLFSGSLNNYGYGVIGAGPRGSGNALTHRVTYEHFIGVVPDGMEIDHLCRVRHCCNPSHLEPVTRRENIMRGRHPWVLRDAAALKAAHDARWNRATA